MLEFYPQIEINAIPGPTLSLTIFILLKPCKNLLINFDNIFFKTSFDMFFTDTHVIVYARPMPRYNPHFVVNLSIDLRWPSPLRLRVICPTLHCSRDRQPPQLV